VLFFELRILVIVVRKIEPILGMASDVSTLAIREVVGVLVMLIQLPWLTVAMDGHVGAREKALVLVLEGY
jgi:hypothetical protein